MKTILQKTAAVFLLAIPSLVTSQVQKSLAIDLTIGLNYAYDPPTGCNNQINNISVDICNNGSSSAGSFLVGIYLYDPATTKHWVLDQTTVNSLSGNACTNISNWNINMNNYPSLPAPGSNYRVGVWADTANVITESNENNNASLLSGNIQVCAASTGIKETGMLLTSFNTSPNPASSAGQLNFNLLKEENVAITICDLTGKVVAKIFEGTLLSGEQKINFNVADLTDGVYFTALKTSGGLVTRKLMVQK